MCCIFFWKTVDPLNIQVTLRPGQNENQFAYLPNMDTFGVSITSIL